MKKTIRRKKGGGEKLKAFSKMAVLTAAPGGFVLSPLALTKAYKEKKRTGKSMSKWINDDSTKWVKHTLKKTKKKLKTMKNKFKKSKNKSSAKSKKKKSKKKSKK